MYERVVRRTLSHGTTAAAYYATTHPDATLILAEICLQYGQRALVGKVCMDINTPEYYRETVEESLESQEKVTKGIRKLDPEFRLIKPVITPRFAVSCTEKLMEALGDYAKKNTDIPIQTHISENIAETEFVKQLFPWSESYANVYDKFGLLNDRTILAHCVYLTDHEIELVRERGAGISHCANSNTSLSSGEAPVIKYLSKGLKIGLGTDCSGGYSVSILDSVRAASNVSRHLQMRDPTKSSQLDLSQLLYMATAGGAKVMGLEETIGDFSVGKEFDALLVDLDDSVGGNVDIFDDEVGDIEKIVAKWVYNGDDRNLRSIWIAGNPVNLNIN